MVGYFESQSTARGGTKKLQLGRQKGRVKDDTMREEENVLRIRARVHITRTAATTIVKRDASPRSRNGVATGTTADRR